jgi:hypothetical protein
MPEHVPDTTDADARRALSDLESEEWQRTLETRGIRPAEAVTDQTREAVIEVLARLSADLASLQRPIRRAVQQLLDGLAGSRSARWKPTKPSPETCKGY